MFSFRKKSLIAHASAVGLVSFLSFITPAALAQIGSGPAQETVKEVQLASEQFERAAPMPGWIEKISTMPELKSKGAVVTRLADSQFMVGNPQSAFVHRAWTINDTSGLGQLGQYGIVFQAGYQRVKLHTLQIRRNNMILDQTKTAKIRFLQRETSLDQGMYNGQVTASMLIDDLRVGDTLELAYTLEGANPVFGGRFVDAASWDNTIPTELRRVTLTHPLDRPVQWHLLGDLNTNIEKPQETVANGMRKLRWEERSLAAVQYDAYVPSVFNVERSLEFSEFKSWGEVSDWADQLFKSNGESLPAELQKVAEVLRSKATAEERVSGALGWVQSQIRYFSVSLGESSHRPRLPNETLERRYGDCKDKSFLLIELLRNIGVQAQPVLLSTRTRTGPSKGLPSPYAFDHAIVRVELDGKTYFLDPTTQGQSGRLDRMGQWHEGSVVLVVKPGNNSLTTITSPNIAELTRNEVKEKIALPKFEGDGTLEVSRTWSGLAAEGLRLAMALWPKDQFEKGLLEAYENRYPGIKVASGTLIEDDVEHNVLTLTTKYTAPKLAVKAGGDWVVRYAANNMQGIVRMPPSATRTQPLQLPVSPRTVQYSLDIEFPPEVSVVNDPQSRTVSDPVFEYVSTTSFRGNRAGTSLTMRLLNDRVDPQNTATFMEAVRKVNAVTQPYFVVQKDEIKSTGFLGLGAKTLQQSIQDRLAERIAVVNKAIDGGKLTGDDLASAYCDRADTLSDMGKAAEALKEAQLAVKTSPNFSDAYSCRASALYAMGDYARSIADYSKAITLGVLDTSAYYRRGQSRFYSGQLAAALTDFSKASDPTTGDPEGALYPELWRVWTQKRLGEASDPKQLQLASANPKGDWPRPALAMLHGLLSVDDVLKQIDRKQGDDKQMALAEAYFYIGQYYYLQGDKANAINYFKKTRALGITIYMEHTGAGFELQQMGETP